MNIEDIKQNNRSAGQFFFSADTMSFWKSRVLESVIQSPTHAYFLTSEAQRNKRYYTIRQYDKATHDVETAEGEESFAYTSLAEAKYFLKLMVPDFYLDLLQVDAIKTAPYTWEWNEAHYLERKIPFLQEDLTSRKVLAYLRYQNHLDPVRSQGNFVFHMDTPTNIEIQRKDSLEPVFILKESSE